jgi:transcriptional regulator of NAD metabolism
MENEQRPVRLPAEGEVVLATTGKAENGVHQVLMYGDIEAGLEILDEAEEAGIVERIGEDEHGVLYRRLK